MEIMREYLCRYTACKQAGLDSACWETAQAAEIDQYPWKSVERPAAPKVLVRLLHTDAALFVRFDIWEKNIRAVYDKPNAPVCRDSCVEFFFCPCAADERYFSFEINPLGALLIGLGTGGSDIIYLKDDRRLFRIETLRERDFWQVAYTIPFAFIRRYYSDISGEMRGNFMKCADRSKTPHHGCWNRIGTEIPVFHVPQYFGKIVLADE